MSSSEFRPAHAGTPPSSEGSPRNSAGYPRERVGTRNSGPLAGIKVADFTWFAAGPLAGQWLGNLGAEVIHVESAG